MIKDLILKNRSYRRFYENETIDTKTLEELIDLARISSCAGNLQSLKYYLSNSKITNEIIFNNIKWAAYLTDFEGPEEGERPSAYILMLNDTRISKNLLWNHGIAATNILLGAVEKGLGGCMFASVNKAAIAKELKIDEVYDIVMVIALGKPKEIVKLDPMTNNNVKYYRDENQIHHVPKRELKDIIVK
ncbi:nitroreductase family protein [Clostridium sp. JN-9]|uniref:nitroreductase family protein n=1 Tax=Clostridium sp. JN-9 TaxID=2507159 RepID=UPI000FFDFFCE|nr:nitroreductase family protein [Clostridium sp. JN-9]QAT40442.1 nitroreductase family protein [Clostridium sp. JN-9]